MPIVITVHLKCDGCGNTIEPPREVKQAAIDPLRWDWKRKHTAVERLHRLTRFYCQACADKPQR